MLSPVNVNSIKKYGPLELLTDNISVKHDLKSFNLMFFYNLTPCNH